MPNEHTTLGSLFSDIADAIREKTGESAQIVADDFPDAIAEIPSGANLVPLSVAENGVYVPTGDVDGYSQVTVNVSGGGGGDITVEPLSVIENGTITAPSGKAYSPVTVTVPTGGDRPNYLLNDGDAVGTIYFNTEFVPDSFLAEINYDREDPQTGLKWAYICFDYLCAADLSSVGLGEGYIIYWGESGIVPIYSTIAFDASQFIPGLVVEEAGWQVSSYPVNITVSISSMSASFKSVMDYVFAKNSIKFG